MKNKKLSDAIKKKYADGWSPRVGKQHSEQTKAEMRIQRKGRQAPKSAFKKGCVPWNKGTKGIMKKNKTSFTSENTTDEKHWCWKGDDAQYCSKHSWVNRTFGKPSTCEHCDVSGLSGHNIHWANIDHKYSRNRKDWIRLCAKCHSVFDKKYN